VSDAFSTVAMALAQLGHDPDRIPDMVVAPLDPTRHPLPADVHEVDSPLSI
jgi:hypothetical protein